MSSIRIAATMLLAFLIASCGGSTGTDAAPGAASAGAVPMSVVKADAGTYTTVVEYMYVAYYGRPGDPSGLAFWADYLARGGAPSDFTTFNSAYRANAAVKTVLDNFGKSDESVALYGTDNTVIVNHIYQNLFNRAPDAGGLAFYVNGLNQALITPAQAAMAIAGGSQGSDLVAIQNKVAVARNFTTGLTAAQTSAYNGLTINAQIRQGLAPVGINSDLTAATNSLLALLSPPTPGAQATISTATALKTVPLYSSLVSVCAPGPVPKSNPVVRPDASLTDLAPAQLQASIAPVTKSFTSTPPADKLGSCGGRRSYPSYSHLNGVTTATVVYSNYCSVKDSTAGTKQFVDGTISFVNTGTPTANGPITTRLDATSSGPVTYKTTDSAGNTLTTQSVSFNRFAYAYGVPGGTPTSANPDVISASELVTTATDGTVSRLTNFSMTAFQAATGGGQLTMSGRGYNTAGTYADFSTTTPFVRDSSGKWASGTLTISGAGGTSTVAKVLTGSSTLQATLSINGTPVTNLPACN